MRVCFISRRFFPAISGMSVYALNLIRQLERDGHDVTMISQYRADPAGVEPSTAAARHPRCPAIRVIGLESKGEQAVDAGPAGRLRGGRRAAMVARRRGRARPPPLRRHPRPVRLPQRPGRPRGEPADSASPTSSRSRGGTATGSAPAARPTGPPSGPCSATPGPSSSAARSFAEEVRGHHGTPDRAVHDRPGRHRHRTIPARGTRRPLGPWATRRRCSITAGSTRARGSSSCSTPSPMLVDRRA